MPRKTIAKKQSHYPRETGGSRMAAKLRKQANSLTGAQRERHFEAGMAMISSLRQATYAKPLRRAMGYGLAG